MTGTNARGFAPTTALQLKRETDSPGRTRVGFALPEPITETEQRFPFFESGVCQWPSDHPTHPHELFVPVDERLVRRYQEGHPQIDVLARMKGLVADERLRLPLLPEDQRHRLLDQIHFDNTGWRFGRAPDKSPLWLVDPTMPGTTPVARARWKQHDFMDTKLLVVEPPAGLEERSLKLVDQALADIRQRLVNEWLGGADQARKLLGLA